MKVVLMWYGDTAARESGTLEGHRLGPTAAALRAEGLETEACVYNDDVSGPAFEQLRHVDVVQVWVNPIEGGTSRRKLDAMLERLSGLGVIVSAHPKTIQSMGTKRVLYDTRHMGWGSDVHLYTTLEEMASQLPERLRHGSPRVLKQFRGHSGHGIWKLTPIGKADRVLARHAARGSEETEVDLNDWMSNCAPYFSEGPMLDQEFQSRISEGTVRCYFVRDRIEGFGHQKVNALAPEPEPGPRLYYPPSLPEFQKLKQIMEAEWLPQLLTSVGLSVSDLPFLWDADFMLGAKTAAGDDTYVLCEINVSSVYPYPESAMAPLARAIADSR